ncbi:MAG: AbgT family transporter [Candidatus Fermentithermobacillus carboniphilus]|uniref:AbgT family transporter n=1 Tax=Candidatus Fermentithermobacillus carboniphilus TaxID=3085328 RepID=A0AAT9LEL3_9FIRM|nr:MAG: AbgT family transporter [Candidatus Fermentithermobacillus carboniphilus]
MDLPSRGRARTSFSISDACGAREFQPLYQFESYFPAVLKMARKYDEKIGVGAIISSMIPYSVARGLGTPAPSLDGPETAFGSRAPKRPQGRRGLTSPTELRQGP